jgi:molecular chaperone Hsp33
MDINKLKEKFHLRDRIVRVLSLDGNFRAVCVKNTSTAQLAQQKHNLEYYTAGFLSRALSASSMLASFLKGEERVIFEVESNGPIRKVFAEALQLGEVRGFVKYSKNFDYQNINNINEYIGVGLLKVSKIMYNKREPIVGIVPIIKGDISTDLTYYFKQSEQIPTLVFLDVDFDENGIINQSGGMIIQAMPGHTKEKFEEIIELTKNLKLINYFNSKLNPLDVLKSVLPFDFELISSNQVDFFCRCSKDSFIEKLMTLELNDILEMQKNNENELVCQYCNTKYYLTNEDFEKMILEMKAKRN